jgi:hypothetical protein
MKHGPFLSAGPSGVSWSFDNDRTAHFKSVAKTVTHGFGVWRTPTERESYADIMNLRSLPNGV